MVQKIKQANIFGRIGTGIGKGLAEQVPEEIQRYRLKQGLQDFEKDHENLTPIQQLARLSSIPGITPQTIQSFSELAKIQNVKNAYGNRSQNRKAYQKPEDISASPLQEVDFANLSQRRGLESQDNQTMNPSNEAVNNQQRTPNVRPTDYNQPQVVNENPLNDKFLTRTPWTPQMRDDRVSQYLEEGFLPDQAKQLQSDDEARDLAEPGANKQRYAELKNTQQEARDALKRHLETKLQKTGEGVYRDLSGENLINLERGMERDLRLKPKSSIEDVANDWSNRALDLAKAKSQLNTLASTTGIEAAFKGNQVLNKLKEYSDIYKKSGNSEEFYNTLKSNSLKNGFDLSSQGAASIAYPLNKNEKNYISSIKTNQMGLLRSEKNSRKYAIEIEEYLNADSSMLSIARSLSQKDPLFDQQAFFDQLSEDKDEIRLNPRQRREIAEGTKNIIPTWGDILILEARQK